MRIKEFIIKYKYIISFIVFIFSFSLFMGNLCYKDSDYLWHIKAGEYMFTNRTILKTDVFSWLLNGKYWISHEWLFECLIYCLKLLFGKYHMFLYSFGCIFSLLFILFINNKKSILSNILFSAIWFSFYLMFSIYIQVRPHMLSFIFLAITIYLCFDLFNNEKSNKIYFLPVISLFWANFHGGSSNLSYLFCFVFLISGLFNLNLKKVECKKLSKLQINKYLITIVLCLLSIIINPHGIKLLFYPYMNMLDSVMISSISEWQPTVISNISHLPYFILVLFIVGIMTFSKKKYRVIDLILLGVVVFLGLKSIRFWEYTFIVMNYVIYNYVSIRKNDKGTCICLLFVSIVFFMIFINNSNLIDTSYNKKIIDDSIIEKIKEVSPNRLYNMYDYGGELIFNDIKVFIDGRADLYSKYNLNDCMIISELGNDFEKLIIKYDFDYFLVNSKYPINYYLNDRYEKIIEKNGVVLYKNKTQD